MDSKIDAIVNGLGKIGFCRSFNGRRFVGEVHGHGASMMTKSQFCSACRNVLVACKVTANPQKAVSERRNDKKPRSLTHWTLDKMIRTETAASDYTKG